MPSRGDVLNVQVPELQTGLFEHRRPAVPAEPDLRPVPLEKLTANGLTDGVRMLTALGMIASDRVKNFFARYHDPTWATVWPRPFGGVESRQAEGLSADAVFAELQVFAGGQPPALPAPGGGVGGPGARSLFEACDIYERPREEEGP